MASGKGSVRIRSSDTSKSIAVIPAAGNMIQVIFRAVHSRQIFLIWAYAVMKARKVRYAIEMMKQMCQDVVIEQSQNKDVSISIVAMKHNVRI